jgi:hypothetical protein
MLGLSALHCLTTWTVSSQTPDNVKCKIKSPDNVNENQSSASAGLGYDGAVSSQLPDNMDCRRSIA